MAGKQKIDKAARLRELQAELSAERDGLESAARLERTYPDRYRGFTKRQQARVDKIRKQIARLNKGG